MATVRRQTLDVGILGYAESAYEKKTTRTLISMLAEVARGALASAGLTREDVDGIAVCSFMLPPDTHCRANRGVPRLHRVQADRSAQARRHRR